MALDERQDVLPAIAHAASDAHKRQVRTALDTPGRQRCGLNLEKLCCFALGEEVRVRYRPAAVTLIDSHLPALPFIVRRIPASM